MVSSFDISAELQNLLNDHKGCVGTAEIYPDKFKIWLGFWGLLLSLARSRCFRQDSSANTLRFLTEILAQADNPLSSAIGQRGLPVLV
jgi:hypothetical protein